MELRRSKVSVTTTIDGMEYSSQVEQAMNNANKGFQMPMAIEKEDKVLKVRWLTWQAEGAIKTEHDITAIYNKEGKNTYFFQSATVKTTVTETEER